MKLTLVVPCFNEEESVIEFYSEVTRVFKDKVEDYELVFVNDGSRDKTPQILRAIYEKADNVKVVNFSRNFGKEAAIYAGLKQSSGDYTCVIDADLQQRPEVVLEMKQILDENADIDCVAAYQGERKESKLLIFFKDKFYELSKKAGKKQYLVPYYLLAVRREAEALDAQLVVGELLSACTVRVHAPELSVADEGNLLSALNPGSICFALCIGGQCLLVLAVGIHDEEHLMTLVLLYTVVTHLVHHLLAVRRSFGATDTSHCPKSLRSHQVVFYLDVIFLNHSLCISSCAHRESRSS